MTDVAAGDAQTGGVHLCAFCSSIEWDYLRVPTVGQLRLLSCCLYDKATQSKCPSRLLLPIQPLRLHFYQVLPATIMLPPILLLPSPSRGNCPKVPSPLLLPLSWSTAIALFLPARSHQATLSTSDTLLLLPPLLLLYVAEPAPSPSQLRSPSCPQVSEYMLLPPHPTKGYLGYNMRNNRNSTSPATPSSRPRRQSCLQGHSFPPGCRPTMAPSSHSASCYRKEQS